MESSCGGHLLVLAAIVSMERVSIIEATLFAPEMSHFSSGGKWMSVCVVLSMLVILAIDYVVAVSVKVWIDTRSPEKGRRFLK
jgi:hypothetical protein